MGHHSPHPSTAPCAFHRRAASPSSICISVTCTHTHTHPLQMTHKCCSCFPRRSQRCSHPTHLTAGLRKQQPPPKTCCKPGGTTSCSADTEPLSGCDGGTAKQTQQQHQGWIQARALQATCKKFTAPLMAPPGSNRTSALWRRCCEGSVSEVI